MPFRVPLIPGWAVALLLVGILLPGGYLTLTRRSAVDEIGTASASAQFLPQSEKAKFANPEPLNGVIGERLRGFSAGGAGFGATVQSRAPRSAAKMDANIERLNATPEPTLQMPSPAASPNDENGQSEVSTVSSGRMVEQTGEIEEQVDDVSMAQSETMNYVKGLRGYVASSQLDKDGSGLPTAVLSLRVPVRQFTALMDHIKTLAKDPHNILTEHVTGEDVTGQYADTAGRVQELEAEQDSYLSMLHSARHIGDLLEIKDRLGRVREELAGLKSQATALKDQSAMSQVDVTYLSHPKIVPPPPTVQPHDWSSETWGSALEGLSGFGRIIGSVLIFAFVFSPIWVPIGLIAWALSRRLR
jgi:hypothetical protein